MIHFFHRLFNYHCEICEDKPRCSVCEELRSLLATEKHEKKQLLDALLERTTIQPPVEELNRKEEKKIIPPKALTWRVRRELLEQEDRAKARIIKERERNEELEKELGINS